MPRGRHAGRHVDREMEEWERKVGDLLYSVTSRINTFSWPA